MFVDIAKISLIAGKGGDGAVSFLRDKNVTNGGPDGGDGGRGGNIVFIADQNLRTLMDFKYKRKYTAENGENGGKKNKFGLQGNDLIIKVPVGTILKNAEDDSVLVDLSTPDKEVVILKGGKGGKGNTHFKTSVRQAPNFSQKGEYGQSLEVVLELKLLADVGLLGYPNVGKSSFLSVVTKARPKTANYHFTTLVPNLGVVEHIKGESFVIADIPGIIEGASEGVGLGHEFLRHVERCKLLIHMVDISGSEGREPAADIEILNSELKKYSEELSTRKQIIVGNKSDIASEDDIEKFILEMKSYGHEEIFVISTVSRQGIDNLMNRVTELVNELEKIQTFDSYRVYSADELKKEDKEIIIEMIEEGFYELSGVQMERLAFSTDVNNVESLRRLQAQLDKRGVFDRLREMGICDGDTVSIFGYEFEYYA